MFDENFYSDLDRELTAEQETIALTGNFYDDGEHREVENLQRERETYYHESARDAQYYPW